MDVEMVTFNGVNAATGGYLFPPVPVTELSRKARDATLDTPYMRLMKRRNAAAEDHFGVMFGVDPDDLAQTGWGLVFVDGTNPAVLDALRPLRVLRSDQAGTRYRELVLKPGEQAEDFLWRHGMGRPDPADPRKVPYYLLIIGDAERIPFSFQYELDVQYAVGRLDFDEPADFAAYAAAVVAAESRPARDDPLPIHLFGTRNAGDTATALSASRLLEPLRDELLELSPHSAISTDIGEGATRERLDELLSDESAAPVLFTATHGLGRSDGDSRDTRGALVCQDWPGPLGRAGPVAPGHYLAAADVSMDRALGPRIVFAFACYSAGAPATSDVSTTPEPGGTSYVARLPQRMLANRERPVLAFVGHVDRAWGYSFLWQGADSQITAMLSTMLSISEGHRLGNAMEYLNVRWAAIATDLTSRLDALRRFGKLIEDPQLAWLWTASNDARNYVVIGDPAVRAW